MSRRRSLVAQTQCIKQLVNECMTFLSFAPAGLIFVGDGEPSDESLGCYLSPFRAWEIHAVMRRRVVQAPKWTDDVKHSIDDGCSRARSREGRGDSPAGTAENSPAIYRWEHVKQTHPSPGGAKENAGRNRHV